MKKSQKIASSGSKSGADSAEAPASPPDALLGGAASLPAPLPGPPSPLPARRPMCPCMSPRPRAWRCSLCRLTRALKVPIRGSLQLLTCHTAHGPPPRPALSAQCGPAVNRVRPARADTRPHTQERAPRQPQLTEAHVAPRWLPCGCAFKCGRSLLFFRVSSWARGVFCCVCSFG